MGPKGSVHVSRPGKKEFYAKRHYAPPSGAVPVALTALTSAKKEKWWWVGKQWTEQRAGGPSGPGMAGLSWFGTRAMAEGTYWPFIWYLCLFFTGSIAARRQGRRDGHLDTNGAPVHPQHPTASRPQRERERERVSRPSPARLKRVSVVFLVPEKGPPGEGRPGLFCCR